MPKFKFSKLVRDKIVEHQLASGAKVNYRELDEAEHKQELVKKIIEEAREIALAADNEVAAEIADVQQAIDDLAEQYGITAPDIKTAQNKKNARNGAFKKGIYVENVEVDDDHEWLEYYRQNPDRYPEIESYSTPRPAP